MPPFLILATLVTPAIIAPTSDMSPHIHEASQQTGLSEPLLRAVISTESGGNTRAVSVKGAMGAMQLMPTTWQYLRNRLDLGADPFEPHDNILAGAFYLRSLYDSYGCNGFLAAYNAGPGRYEKYRDTGRPLPLETQIYVARITAKLNTTACNVTPGQGDRPDLIWNRAALFAVGSDADVTVPNRFLGDASPFVPLPTPLPAAPPE